MVFSSLIFLFAFLPLTLLLVFAVPKKFKNPTLFLCSAVFYGWAEPRYLLLMLFSIASAYGFGLLIDRSREKDPKRARLFTILSVTVSVALLFFFKYYNFFAENLSRLPFLSVPILSKLILPIGISFYTFQILSYTVDLYRGNCAVQKNFIAFGTYVTLFPQLIAGPIVRYRDIDGELRSRCVTVADFSDGVLRFCVGLAKKVLIGDALAAGCEYFKTATELSPTVLGAWAVVVLYSLHLYYDFSGYSDMAIGLGRMLGFHFPENFNYPYLAKSLTDFWRRWHISLSSWFREYVYIPLGGNRKGTFRCYRNICVVWLLTGFWHGANWNFLLWGVYYAVLLMIEKAFLSKFLEKIPAVFSHLYALLGIGIGFLIFSYTDLGAGMDCLGALVGIGTGGFSDATTRYTLLRYLPLIALSCLGCTPLVRDFARRCTEKHPKLEILRPIVTAFLLLLCVSYLVDSTFSPFEYTQF